MIGRLRPIRNWRTRLGLAIDQARLDAPTGQARHFAHPDFFHDVGPVLFDRAHAQIQLGGDLLRHLARRDQARNFLFSLGKRHLESRTAPRKGPRRAATL